MACTVGSSNTNSTPTTPLHWHAETLKMGPGIHVCTSVVSLSVCVCCLSVCVFVVCVNIESM